jgi:hypothetical protein
MNHHRCRWHDMYVAVLFETDPSKVCMRIADALITMDNAIRNEPNMDGSEQLAIRSARKTLAMMETDKVLDMIGKSFCLGVNGPPGGKVPACTFTSDSIELDH